MDILNGIGGALSRLAASEHMSAAGLAAIEIVITVIVGMIAIKILLQLTKRALKKSSIDAVLYKFIINLLRAACVIILVTMCLGYLGVQTSTIIAVIGAAGAAIALALKDSLANIAGGVMIIITKPFKRDDLIDVGEVSGLVKDIDLFITTLVTYDNKTITIPNGVINTSVLVNHSREDIRRVDCKFLVGHGADIRLAKELMERVCRESDIIFDVPKPIIGVAEGSDDSITLDLLAWCATADYWTVKYILEERVREVFAENGIDIPSQRVDVKTRDEKK